MFECPSPTACLSTAPRTPQPKERPAAQQHRIPLLLPRLSPCCACRRVPLSLTPGMPNPGKHVPVHCRSHAHHVTKAFRRCAGETADGPLDNSAARRRQGRTFAATTQLHSCHPRPLFDLSNSILDLNSHIYTSRGHSHCAFQRGPVLFLPPAWVFRGSP